MSTCLHVSKRGQELSIDLSIAIFQAVKVICISGCGFLNPDIKEALPEPDGYHLHNFLLFSKEESSFYIASVLLRI